MYLGQTGRVVDVNKEGMGMIELKNLTKSYPNQTEPAVKGVDMHVKKGEFFGLLGPNGAGKTTMIEMMTTLLLPTAGEILISGQKLARNRVDLKKKFSLVTQEYSLRSDMNSDQIMELQGRLHGMPVKLIRSRTNELLEACDLAKHRKKIMRKLSGGMKRKLMLCRALLTEPEIIFLDEPTAGLDLMFRRQMWDLLRKLNEEGLTIMLTTHYIEEAEALCHRVAMMRSGEIVRLENPKKLIAELGEISVDVFDGNVTTSYYFGDKEMALAFASTTHNRINIRNTSLEDVFVKISESGVEIS